MPDLLSRNPDFTFLQNELEDQNNVMLLPPSLFAVNDSLAKKILSAQKTKDIYLNFNTLKSKNKRKMQGFQL